MERPPPRTITSGSKIFITDDNAIAARFSKSAIILAEAGSKTLSVNGAAAHKVSIDDVVIICTYGSYDETEAKTHIPTLVYFDKSNNVTKVKNTIPEQKLKSV